MVTTRSGKTTGTSTSPKKPSKEKMKRWAGERGSAQALLASHAKLSPILQYGSRLFGALR
jgi:hypothetical protein